MSKDHQPKIKYAAEAVFRQAVASVKEAIVCSRYQAATRVNGELLSLYYAVGKFVSKNSRADFWGKGAVSQLSDALQRELPGLRGFSASSIKRMREFYEEWHTVLANRPLPMGDLPALENAKKSPENLSPLQEDNHSLTIDLSILPRQLQRHPKTFADAFTRTGFTHHSEILAKEKTLEGRLFYIARCAAEFWSVEALKTNLRGNLFTRIGILPNNFSKTLSEAEQARRAIRSFKDEYLLDFINIEDENDPDERLVERGVVANIKQFLLSFGNKFCFIGNQYHVEVGGKEFF
jgi:predicted nuclease of restriction endonuclease-like (RecB) superfamily